MIFCLDGAPYDLVSSLMAGGKIPNLANLAQRGVWGPLESVVPPVTAPAFASILTGQYPAEHGVLHFKKNPLDTLEPVPRAEGDEFVTSSVIRGKTFPDILSMAGFTVGTVGVPLTYPPWEVGAFMVCGFLTPPSASVWTSPPALGKDIERWIPEYRYEIRWELDHRLDAVNKIPLEMKEGWSVPPGLGERGEALLREINQVTEQRTSLTLSLMEEYDPDLMMVYFRGPDLVQHYYYHRRDVLEAFYSGQDKCLGTIMDKMPRNVDTFVISDHGFRPIPGRRFSVNAWLSKEGYLQMKRDYLSKALRSMYIAGRSVKRIVYRAGKKGGKQDKHAKQARQGRISSLVKKGKDPIDWEKTVAYGGRGGVIIKKTREKETRETRKLSEEIKTRLSNLRDPETGEKVAQWVSLREEAFQGPFLHKLPHVVYKTRNSHKYNPEITKDVFSTQPKGERTGDHDTTGIFLASGPNISRKASLGDADLVKIAPTLLHLYGVPIPDYMSGKVLPIFRSDTDPGRLIPSRTKSIGLTRRERLKIKRLKKLSQSKPI